MYFGTTLEAFFSGTWEWRHNERHDVSNHRCLDCLLNRFFWHTSTKTSKRRVTGLCEGNLPVTGEFPSQRAINAENITIWWLIMQESMQIRWCAGSSAKKTIIYRASNWIFSIYPSPEWYSETLNVFRWWKWKGNWSELQDWTIHRLWYLLNLPGGVL